MCNNLFQKYKFKPNLLVDSFCMTKKKKKLICLVLLVLKNNIKLIEKIFLKFEDFTN